MDYFHMTSRPAAILVYRKNCFGNQCEEIFSCKTFLLLQDICIAAEHASENDLLAHIPKNSLNSEITLPNNLLRIKKSKLKTLCSGRTSECEKNVITYNRGRPVPIPNMFCDWLEKQ